MLHAERLAGRQHRPQQHGHRESLPGRRHPGAAKPAPAVGLVGGDQGGELGLLAAGRALDQFGVGRVALLEHDQAWNEGAAERQFHASRVRALPSPCASSMRDLVEDAADYSTRILQNPHRWRESGHPVGPRLRNTWRG